ncbi:MAG: c-type cytochrome [Lewinella sp.]|jgi:mono/diheme cytochrome c family protein|uniref:c-type cytochrome n=1 Tax=Lewinella sp. TaxID=2004506 RepID=UPI003D6B90D0
MKKPLRIIGRLLLGLILLLLLFVAFIAFSSPPTYTDVQAPSLAVDLNPEAIARGQKLVDSNCRNCHRSASGTQMIGRIFEDRGANSDFGTIYTANITKHPTAGIGDYTDGELYRLLRTGIKQNNERAIAVMPTWPLASEQDIHDIIAFLRSDHPWVAPSNEVHPPHQSSLLSKALHRFVLTPTPYQTEYPTNPSLSDSVAYGAYQVNNVNLCYYCHSADIKAASALEPKATPGYMAGGFVFLHLDYDIPVPGLIPTADNNVGKWTIEEFVDAVKFGQRPDLPAYKEPMHPFNLLDTAEVRAIHHYLSSLQ